MPWHVGSSDQCPVSKPYAVIKDSDDSLVACHATEEQAKKQVAALYANDTNAGGGYRSTKGDELLPQRSCERAYNLDDLHIRSDGSSRVVEAYAAVFNQPAEVMDQDGHYNETLPDSSFNRTIAHKGPAGFGVLFNHARTVDGTPSDTFSMPLAVPLEVAADGKGVFTASRYLDHPLADSVLDLIKQGAIKAQSFSGRFLKSTRSYPQGHGRGNLPLITRHEVDMREYGPAVFAAYKGAEILGTRAEQFIRSLLSTPPDERLAFLEQFEGLTTPIVDTEALTVGTPDGPAESAEDSPVGHSARSLRSHIRAARIARHME
jgi:HK97 family phage prohead protease